jgi:hypothetical protein
MASCAAAGPVVAIGGALRHDNDAVWSRLAALSGDPQGSGRAAVVPPLEMTGMTACQSAPEYKSLERP